MPDVLVPLLVCLAGPAVAVALVVIAQLTGPDLHLASPGESRGAASRGPQAPHRDIGHRRGGRRPGGATPPEGDVCPQGPARQGAAPAASRPAVALLNRPKRTEPSHG